MNASDKNIDLNIKTTRGSKQFSFPKQTKVEEVIRQVVSAFGFAAGDSFQLVLASNPSCVSGLGLIANRFIRISLPIRW